MMTYVSAHVEMLRNHNVNLFLEQIAFECKVAPDEREFTEDIVENTLMYDDTYAYCGSCMKSSHKINWRLFSRTFLIANRLLRNSGSRRCHFETLIATRGSVCKEIISSLVNVKFQFSVVYKIESLETNSPDVLING